MINQEPWKIIPTNETLVPWLFDTKEVGTECLHMKCPMCKGTGVKYDGSICVHGLSCPCKRCSPYC